jgi:hypothetical protein
VGRFRLDLNSNAIVEAFGADLEETRSFPDLALPSLRIGDQVVSGAAPYSEWRAAALAAGGVPVAGQPALSPLDAVVRFGRTASIEVETVCELAGPVARAELWRLAAEWRIRPLRVLTGVLWEPA